MVIKLKSGCLVETIGIKIAEVTERYGSYKIEISYNDEKKNPNKYISCESKEEGEKLIDKLLEEIKNGRTVKLR